MPLKAIKCEEEAMITFKEMKELENLLLNLTKREFRQPSRKSGRKGVTCAFLRGSKGKMQAGKPMGLPRQVKTLIAVQPRFFHGFSSNPSVLLG